MLYITIDDDGVVRAADYIQYLDTIQHLLSPDQSNLVAPERLDFRAPGTLKESTIEKIVVDIPHVQLSLAGRWNDRVFELRYTGVTHLEHSRPWDGFHPLYFQEMTLSACGYRHYLHFHSGSAVILAQDLAFREVLRPATH